MGFNSFVKVGILIGASALLIQCSGHSHSNSQAVSAPNNSQNACQSFAVPCSVSHGTGTQSCTDSASGPSYGDCENVVCDPGFNMNSDSVCVGGENVKTFSMLVTGPSLAPAGVSSFIAELGSTYDFVIAGSQNVVSSGLNSSASYAKYISGQCSGIGYKYQPLTTNFQVSGATVQFGDNNVTYTPSIADAIGGCIWQVCAVSNDTTVLPACVNMIASVDPNPSPTTTTIPAPTTTLSPVTTTLPSTTTTTTSTLPPTTTTSTSTTSTTVPVTTTTSTLPPTTTTSTTLPHPTTTTTLPSTTTTTTLPHPVTTTTSTTLPHPTTTTTTLPPTTTTTTLPHVMPTLSGTTCAGGGSGQYNCTPLIQGGTGANNLKKDIGCTLNVTITYKGQTVTTSLFGNAAPYYQNGQGIGTTSKVVPIQGVNFMLYLTDEYSLSEGRGWESCVPLISWPNYPNAPQ